MLNDSCRYFEPAVGLLIRRTNRSIMAGSTVWIEEAEIRCYDHQDKRAIPFVDEESGKTFYFLEEELDYQVMNDQGQRNFVGPQHSLVTRYSQKGGGWDLLPDGFIIGKPGFMTSIPFYSKKRGLEVVSSDCVNARILTAMEAIEVAEAIEKSDLPDGYV